MAALLRRSSSLVCLILLATSPSSSQAKESGIVLVRSGRPVSAIIVGKNAPDYDKQAARELQKYLKKMSGAEVSLLSTLRQKTTSAVFIGSPGNSAGFPRSIDWNELGEDGFTLLGSGSRLYIAGGNKRGSLYAVYTLLESYLGCRKFSPTVEVIPTKTTITLPPIRTTQIPKIRFRDAHFTHPEYRAWHKLDDHNELFGLYVHTFQRLVPPERYFNEHPEYFTKAAAGRVPDAQLCLTNPDVFRIVVDELRERMRANPTLRYWSVSQNDTFSPCGCDDCRAVDSVEGSPSGSLLAFVNRVAEQFPEKIISTLAYQYSRAAPRTIRPRDNVNIMLCSIECNRSRPLESDPTSASFRKDVEDWTKLTKNIYMWDYVVQFRNLISPFPNLRILQPNIRYFARNGIGMMFQQGSGGLPNEFKELRTYLIAKLLWTPNINLDSVMNDFLVGFYGKAAPAIREYIDVMHNALEASGEELGIYGFPLPSENGYLSASNIDKYTTLFDNAERAVGDDTVMLQRVQTARLPLQFALLEQAKTKAIGPRGFFEQGTDQRWHPKPAMRNLLATFIDRCKRFGITTLNELGTTPDDYLAASDKYLQVSMRNHLALFKKVKLSTPASKKYHNGDESALTDGVRGLDDYHLNWLGFEGEDLEATIDLGVTQQVQKVETAFLQDINAWIFLPTVVQVAISEEGQTFRTIATLPNQTAQDRKGVWSVPFNAAFAPLSARFVRVKATGLRTCPNWHKGAGGLCWVFADEIVVE